jgi:hypothetical protein
MSRNECQEVRWGTAGIASYRRAVIKMVNRGEDIAPSTPSDVTKEVSDRHFGVGAYMIHILLHSRQTVVLND